MVQTRYKKLVKKLAAGEKVPSELLVAEEEKVFTSCSPVVEAYHNFAASLLRGQITAMGVARESRAVALRFLKDVPEIIGADMKTHGPFKAEDVASLRLGMSRC